ncbi:anti-sigma factor antagonist [Amycolatopsis balhimycina DSM 5908]|uniref:Anti-sigma factor antagonist n=1 Tax=Amycolatopsis balhimycina DSM 5908 TaxID=1081091 RepID=A0A428VZS5_AMYBA|nr:STAS domain-containing protein [Amycolatopsis balhimycina]RSM36332.1 anti-sigma factor antagonist [Amycolatopsis balhimycina DSM 5908]
MTTPFSATTHPAGTGPVVTVLGEVDVATAPRLRAEIGALTLGPGQLLVIDLAGVTFCDSSGISALIAARNLAEEAGAGVALAAVPARLSRTFALIGLGDFFPAYASAEEAIASHPAVS